MTRRAAKVDANQPGLVWSCDECGVEKRWTVHQARQRYCSRACVSSAYRRRMAGRSNPNFKNAGVKVCVQCGSEYSSYSSAKKYCSASCYAGSRRTLSEKRCIHCGDNFQPNTAQRKFCSTACVAASRRTIKKEKKKRKAHITQCAGCGTDFKSSPSSKRKYCTYQCHLEHGGAQRAGAAAVVAKLKYGAKKDANHKEIFSVIAEITAVHDLSAVGFGCPDGIAWVNDGWQFFDVKNPKTQYGKRGLNEIQKKWASDWRGGSVYLLYSTEDAEQFAKGDFCGLKRFPSGGEVLYGGRMLKAAKDKTGRTIS